MRRSARTSLTAAAMIVSAALCRTASANDPATATMLFNDAKALASAGRYPEACPKFEESQRLDPGIGTQYNLADCYEHTARAASAWALFLDVASSAGGNGQEARENLARRRATALEPRLSKLTISVAVHVLGLEVRRNGEVVAGLVWNRAVPVDPGTYRIEATAPNRRAWSTMVTVGSNGGTTAVEIPDLEPGAEAPAPVAAPRVEDLPSLPPTADTSGGGDPGRTQKNISLALGGLAIVGIGVGSFFGLRSISKHSDYEQLCSGTICQPAAAPIHTAAVTAGNVSTVAFVAGGVTGVAAAALWILAPKSKTVGDWRLAPLAGPSMCGVIVDRGF